MLFFITFDGRIKYKHYEIGIIMESCIRIILPVTDTDIIRMNN